MNDDQKPSDWTEEDQQLFDLMSDHAEDLFDYITECVDDHVADCKACTIAYQALIMEVVKTHHMAFVDAVNSALRARSEHIETRGPRKGETVH